jgi:26S proteasome regulatory subunit N1
MTYSDTQPRGTLQYRLLSASASQSPSEPGSWGHEYIRHLSAELGSEFAIRSEVGQDTAELLDLGIQCAKFLIGHNAEADAVDLLEELESVNTISNLVNGDTFARVCAYMLRLAVFLHYSTCSAECSFGAG